MKQRYTTKTQPFQSSQEPATAAVRPGGTTEHASLALDLALPAMLADLHARLQPVPEIRQQRVVELRDALANGTYQLSPRQTAEAMIADFTLR